MSTTVSRAQEAWGADLPSWVHVLATHCDSSSQKAVATKIGYSPAVVNQVLSRRYTGDMEAVELAVRGALLDYTITCPELGELAAHHCLEYQKLPFAATNPQRVRLFRACRVCEHNRNRRTPHE